MARRDGADGPVEKLEHPDIAWRARSALANPNAGELLVSAAEGWELADLGGRHHAGGGSHGSLLAGDSFAPVVTVGLETELRRITDVAPAVLAHFGVAVPESMEALAGARLTSGRGWSSRSSAGAASTTSACSPRWDACRVSSSFRRSCARRAYADAALPIGGEQTISQPYMVALICEQLALHGSERVLDVGTGSGYQAAVLAELAAEVHTIERIPELAERAARISPRPATRAASISTSATARWASRSARRSPRSPSLPPRSRRRPRSTSSSSHAVASSSRWAAPANSGSRSSCGRPRARPSCAPSPAASSPGGGPVSEFPRRPTGEKRWRRWGRGQPLSCCSFRCGSAGSVLGRPVDLLLDPAEWRALGFVVLLRRREHPLPRLRRRRPAGGRDRRDVCPSVARGRRVLPRPVAIPAWAAAATPW